MQIRVDNSKNLVNVRTLQTDNYDILLKIYGFPQLFVDFHAFLLQEPIHYSTKRCSLGFLKKSVFFLSMVFDEKIFLIMLLTR